MSDERANPFNPLAFRLLIYRVLLVLFLSQPAMRAAEVFSNEILSGQRFLTNLFDSSLELLPEYDGAKVYWLFHDNYLAAKLLKSSHPDLALRIEHAMRRFGVLHSGKIEILFDEATNALPFRAYQLLQVTNIAGKIIRTERITPQVLKGWDAYADLLLLAAIAKSKTAPDEAKHHFHQALALWDGHGFADLAFKKQQLHATYKLALAVICADLLHEELPMRSDALQQLRKLQSASGGWITDYDLAGKPHGFANVETTCMVLLALQKTSKDR